MQKSARRVFPLHFKDTLIFISQNITQNWVRCQQHAQLDTNLNDSIHTWKAHYFKKVLNFPNKGPSLLHNTTTPDQPSVREGISAQRSPTGAPKCSRIPAPVHQSFRISNYMRSKIGRETAHTFTEKRLNLG